MYIVYAYNTTHVPARWGRGPKPLRLDSKLNVKICHFVDVGPHAGFVRVGTFSFTNINKYEYDQLEADRRVGVHLVSLLLSLGPA